MSDSFIDEDLNFDVTIDLKKFRNPNDPELIELFNEGMRQFFNDPQELCDFMTEVGKNHPEGVNMRYLLQLVTYFTTSQALIGLENNGLISSKTVSYTHLRAHET